MKVKTKLLKIIQFYFTNILDAINNQTKKRERERERKNKLFDLEWHTHISQ